MEPTHIFLTHGHADHYGDVVDIAKRTGAQTVAIVELANELAEQGASRTWPIRTSAARSSSTAAGCASRRPGTPRSLAERHTPSRPPGLVINLGGKTVYHLGDTGLFSDLALPGRRDTLDVALMLHRRPLHDGPPRRRRGGELVGAER